MMLIDNSRIVTEHDDLVNVSGDGSTNKASEEFSKNHNKLEPPKLITAN
jgi:hypothetical protein